MFLHDHGFSTVEAGTVERALQILGSEHVDAVILDVRLPDPHGMPQSGLSLLAYLRLTPEYQTLPVLIVTGKPLSPEDEDLIRRSEASVFHKPFSYSVLVEQLRRLTGHGMA